MRATGSFWVVCTPSHDSELADILFLADMHRLELQVAGGLQLTEIVAFFESADADKAHRFAMDLLNNPEESRS